MNKANENLRLKIYLEQIWKSIIFIGGFLPSVRAARMNILAALRAE